MIAPVEQATSDRLSLKRRLRQLQRVQNLRAVALVLPLLLFTGLIFATPILLILTQSVANPEIVEGLPRTTATIDRWNGSGTPSEEVYAALAADLKQGYANKTISVVAARLNYEIPGFRTVLLKTGRRIAAVTEAPYKSALIEIDPAWNSREYWAVIKRNASRVTDFHFLAALDLRRGAENDIVSVPANEALYVDVFVRTLTIALTVTILCLMLGYPVAYLLATRPARLSNVLMIFVLLPFWTSALIRTTAWIVLLQREGMLNHALEGLGLISAPLSLIYNRLGLLISMVHVMLPFMILPLYSVMKGIAPHHMRAARSLGAHPVLAFLTIYVPLTVSGIGSGCLLVFIVSVGFYITPELIGGGGDQMIAHFIAVYANELLNWGGAAALAILLLAMVSAIYALFHRFLSVDRL